MSRYYDIINFFNRNKIECEKCKQTDEPVMMRVRDKNQNHSAHYFCVKCFEKVQGKL